MMIKQAVKTPSSIGFNLTQLEVSGANINVHNELSSHYNVNASMSALDYSVNSGSSFSVCTLGSVQFESDISSIYLTGKPKDVKIVWNAAADLNATSSYDGVVVRQKYNVDGFPYTSYATYYKSASVDVDFTPSNKIPLDRPYPTDNNFTASFKVPTCVYPVRCHFTLEIDTSDAFDSAADFLAISSSASQTGWQVSSSSFPAGGAITATSSLGQLEVLYHSAALKALDTQTYYLRVSRSLYER